MSPGASADTLDVVVDKLIEAYGGEVRLRSAERMIQEWDFLSLATNQRGTDRRSLLLPGHLKVELTYPHKSEVRLLTGKEGFVAFSASGVRAAPPMQRDAMRLQLMRHYSPLALRDRIGHLELRSGDRHEVLSLREFGLRVDYYVNVDTWHVERVVGHLPVGGGEMTFVTEYSDHGKVDGILVHRRENKFAGDVNTARLHLRSIEFDVEFGDADFSLGTETRQGGDTVAKN